MHTSDDTSKKNDKAVYDVDPQFDDLISDPNGMDTLKAILTRSVVQRNTMTLNEFRKYECLFQYGMRESLGQTYYNLLAEYSSKISVYHPVMIVDDDERDVLLMVLPPIFKQVSMISNTGQVGIDVSQAFINVNNLPDDTSGEKRSKYGYFYKELLNAAEDAEERERINSIADEMTKSALTISHKRVPTSQDSGENEIENISEIDFKDNEIAPLSIESEEQDGDIDEFSDM